MPRLKQANPPARDIKGLLEKGILKAERSARAVPYRLKIEGS